MAAVVHPSQPRLRRDSPQSMFQASHGYAADAKLLHRLDMGSDSDSDDEPPPAIKFSKVTQALLDNVAVASSPPRQDNADPSRHRSASTGHAGVDTPSRVPGLKSTRRVSPSASRAQAPPSRGSTPPRVVHLGSSRGVGSAKRSVSIAGPYPPGVSARREPTPEASMKPELVTPAPRGMRMTRARTGSNASQDGAAVGISSTSRPGSRAELRAAIDAGERKHVAIDLSRSSSMHHAQDAVSRFGTSTIMRSRNPSADTVAPPGSTRIKRAPVGTGSFLKSGPVRRGFRRRDSEENASANEDVPSGSSSHPSSASYTPYERGSSQSQGTRSRSDSMNNGPSSAEPVSVHDFAQSRNAAGESRPGSRQASTHFSRSNHAVSRPASRQSSRERPGSRQASVERSQPRRQPSVDRSDVAARAAHESRPRKSSIDQDQPRPSVEQPPSRVSSYSRPTYRYVPPAALDQENVPPPTFKRNKDQEFKYLGKPSVALASDGENPKRGNVEETPVPVSHQEQRKVLGTISGNTPHRPAPAPPPKMSVLETATTTAGASTTKSRKKRQHMVVNGKIFTQMGKIGKGGSSDVYCVMAENYKTFALKRVKLDDCDESAVRGYKGEIDLLKKLTEVERVVRLFDWELNEDKQELVVLMEKGDTDLNRILTLRLNGADAIFDSAFTRYYWKEMLECVEAVHEHDIVHSDLKPANFLMVQGRLKLIDFGIANAIDTDNTCNVHRDSHVGTPNYMSPESITDTNQAGRDEAGRPLKKDMRIGKSSDVWSLGCILYQMAYGRPPFAHISNQISRIMAITNPRHTIEFPEIGVGGSYIPPTLRGTLRRCLNRNPDFRPTVRELLSSPSPTSSDDSPGTGADYFLHPEGGRGDSVLITEELLGQIITKVVDRCRDPKRGVPEREEVQQYPRSFMAKIREMYENR